MKPQIAGLVLLISAGMFACGQSQAGSDYPGEPLMTLRGVVRSPAALSGENLVPGVRFDSLYDNMHEEKNCSVTTTCAFTTYYTKGEVEGEFPSSFILQLYDPPPADVLEVYVQGESAVAVGDIVAISPNHPAWLRKEMWTEMSTPSYWESVSRVCSDSGQCLTSYPSRECPAEGSWELSAPFPCGNDFPDEFPWDLYGYSESHGLIYFEDPVPAGAVLSQLYAEGAGIEAGYHVLRIVDLEATLPPDAHAANASCMAQVSVDATIEVNRVHGTDYMATLAVIDAGFQQHADQFQTWNDFAFRAYVERGCRLGFEIADPTASPTELIFTQATPFESTW